MEWSRNFVLVSFSRRMIKKKERKKGNIVKFIKQSRSIAGTPSDNSFLKRKINMYGTLRANVVAIYYFWINLVVLVVPLAEFLLHAQIQLAVQGRRVLPPLHLGPLFISEETEKSGRKTCRKYVRKQKSRYIVQKQGPFFVTESGEGEWSWTATRVWAWWQFVFLLRIVRTFN